MDLSPLALILIAVAFLVGIATEDVHRWWVCRTCRWNPKASGLPEWKPQVCAYRIHGKEGETSRACTHLAVPGEVYCRQHWQETHGVGPAA